VHHGKPVSDIFPDPTDATLVLAVVVDARGYYIVASPRRRQDLRRSADLHEHRVDHRRGALSVLAGVIYVTSINGSGSGATLARSDDHGATGPTAHDRSGRHGAADHGHRPEDADTVYLRVTNGGCTDSVVITTDGGQTVETALTVTGQFSSFLASRRRRRSTLGELGRGAPRPRSGATEFTSHPGRTFAASGSARHVAGLRLWRHGLDGFSVGYSDDSGQTFQRMMSFIDCSGP
jgi:hypothetical protein